MPAHLKAVLLLGSLTIPISNGRLALGNGKGSLCEHRDDGGRRRVVVTLSGQVRTGGPMISGVDQRKHLPCRATVAPRR